MKPSYCGNEKQEDLAGGKRVVRKGRKKNIGGKTFKLNSAFKKLFFDVKSFGSKRVMVGWLTCGFAIFQGTVSLTRLT